MRGIDDNDAPQGTGGIEANLIDRRVVIPAKDWDGFEAWARAREIAGLKELARRPPTWRK